MTTLIIIYGQLRTLETCIRSIFLNVIYPNRPCHIALSVDGSYADIPPPVITLLNASLIDIYTTQHKTVQRDYHRIEFSLVYEALRRIPDLESYAYCLKVRTDIYVKHELCPISILYGECPRDVFTRRFMLFCQSLPFKAEDEPQRALVSWFMCAGMPQFIPHDLEKTNSPWSLTSPKEWNTKRINEIMSTSFELKDVFHHVKRFARKYGIVVLIGSTWIHYGPMTHIDDLSREIYSLYGTLSWPNVHDADVLEWADHKGRVHRRPHSSWKWITDNQLRLLHHTYTTYMLVDLVNPGDYIESFDATHNHVENIKDPARLVWIVRRHQTTTHQTSDAPSKPVLQRNNPSSSRHTIR
jgi:hypothetical protein